MASVKTSSLVLFFGVALRVGAGEVETFDPQHPPKVEPGKIYRLKIRPTPKSKVVFIDFHAGKEAENEFVPIETTTQGNGEELLKDDEARWLDVEVADYNLDGTTDFRLLAGRGTGGSWYSYYRWNGKRYVPWDEPADLGINFFDLAKRIAVSRGRSGPSWTETLYHIRGGHFQRFKTMIFDFASGRREIIPKDIPDDEHVFIVEDYDGKRLKKRVIKRGADAESSAEH